MVYFLTRGVEIYHDYMKLADPRMNGWFMMDSIFPTLAVMFLYLLAVKLGPRFMEKRNPVEIKPAIIGYNFAMVILSFYMFVEMALCWVKLGYGLGCETVDYSDSHYAVRLARVSWLFLMSKFVEILDTIFFILRKKSQHLSFLHVFHHGVIPIFWWPGIRFAAGGSGSFHLMINVLVHTIMYTYYGLAACGPKYQKYLWWKRYLTLIQLTQFTLVTVHSANLLITDCSYPKLCFIFIDGFSVVLGLLFLNFYIKSYLSNRKKGAQVHATQNGYAVQNGDANSTLIRNRKGLLNGQGDGVNVNDFEYEVHASNGAALRQKLE